MPGFASKFTSPKSSNIFARQPTAGIALVGGGGGCKGKGARRTVQQGALALRSEEATIGDVVEYSLPEVLSYCCIRPQAPSVCGLGLLVYEALSY